MRFSQLLLACSMMLPMIQSAEIQPVLNLEKMVEDSTLIIRGTLLQEPDPRPNGTALSIAVSRVIKGVAKADVIQVESTMPDASAVNISQIKIGTYRIFFLSQSDGKYRFVDRRFPSFAGSPGFDGSGLSVLDSVIGELGSSIGTIGSSRQDRETLYALSTVPRASATAALRAGLHSNDPGVRLSAASALLRRGDAAQLSIVLEALHRPGAYDPELISNAIVSLRDGVSAPEDVPKLSFLAESNLPEARRSLISILQRVGSPASIQILLRELDDSEPTIRYWAVRAIGRVVEKGKDEPTQLEFKRNEGLYISKWKSWASLNGYQASDR